MIILSETGCRSSPFKLFSPNYIKLNLFLGDCLVRLGQRHCLPTDLVEVLVNRGEIQQATEQLVALADDRQGPGQLDHPGGADVALGQDYLEAGVSREKGLACPLAIVKGPTVITDLCRGKLVAEDLLVSSQGLGGGDALCGTTDEETADLVLAAIF